MKRHARVLSAAAVLSATLVLGVSLAAAIAPVVTIEDASSVSYTSAEVAGTVDPQGQSTTYRFNYAPQAQFEAEGFDNSASQLEGSTEAPGPLPPGKLTGLAPGTVYHLRLVAENADGSSEAIAANTFQTKAVPAPVVTTDDASAVKFTTAHASGTIDPGGEDPEGAFNTTCHFEATPQAQFEAEGFENAPAQVGCEYEGGGEFATGSSPVAVEADLTGLANATTYHLRLVASNAGGSAAVAAADTFTTQTVTKPVVVLDAPVVGPEKAVISGTIDPGGDDPAFDVSYQIEYSIDNGATWLEIGGEGFNHNVFGAGAQPVEDEIEELEPHTTYKLRIRAENQGGTTIVGGQSFETPAIAPEVITVGTLDSTDATATFRGRINAHKSLTVYWFEYGTAPGTYTTAIPASKDASAGAGKDPVYVAETATGLNPETTYYYRLVADNGTGGPIAGEEREVTTREVPGPEPVCANAEVRAQQGASDLPECRAYEQVSPPDKNGSDVQNFIQMADDGDALAWDSLGAYANTPSANGGAIYVARRGERGHWSTSGFGSKFIPAVRPGLFTSYTTLAFDDDLRKMTAATRASRDPEDKDFIVQGTVPLTLAYDVYQVGEDHEAVWLSRNEGGPPSNELVSAKVAGVSSDGNSVFIETPESLVPGLPTGSFSDCLSDTEQRCNLYRWHAGHLEAVGHDENGQLLSSAGLGGSHVVGPVEGGGNVGTLPDHDAVSSDGSSFVYGGYPAGIARQLYLRRADGSVVHVSASQRSGSVGQPAESGAEYVCAYGDLASIYFRSRDQLTDDAPAGGGDYRYDVATGELTFSNVDDQLTASTPGGFIRASVDGRYVYYISGKALAPGASVGAPNLYVKGPGGVRFIAFVRSTGDGREIAVIAGSNTGPDFTSSGLSDDGTKFVFATETPAVAGTPKGVQQVYLYDAENDALKCVSCAPEGTLAGLAGLMPEADWGLSTPRAVSRDGSRVVFSADAALVPQDENGVGDIYEYVDGEVHLVSDGVSSFRSILIGMSESGDDIFFSSRASLAASDTDRGQYDIYDAHVNGGVLATGAPPAPPCNAENCLLDPGVPPGAASASSAMFRGPANAKPHRHHLRKKHRKRSKGKRSKGKAAHRAGSDGRAGR